MPLAKGRRLGVYEIVDALGAGGMGEVYRARDTKLRRDVAIKILPEAFALDPDRVARFQREAELLAALNHPNIAAVFGVEESEGASAIVMELVDGESLDEKLLQPSAIGPQPSRGLPLNEVFDIARQMADALEAAHERGVIHRDLKPANIKITPEGRVKVLDFGLAKMADSNWAERRRRRRASARESDPVADDAGDTYRRHPGDRRLHVARAGARQGRRPASGHLGIWLRRL